MFLVLDADTAWYVQFPGSLCSSCVGMSPLLLPIHERLVSPEQIDLTLPTALHPRTLQIELGSRAWVAERDFYVLPASFADRSCAR